MIKKIYQWKELSCDGLLKEPKECGPDYSNESINGYEGGFENEGEALNHLEYMKKKYDFDVPTRLMLVTEYKTD